MSSQCKGCDHLNNPQGGHCYMFLDPPKEPCMQHTERAVVYSPRIATFSAALAIIATLSENVRAK